MALRMRRDAEAAVALWHPEGVRSLPAEGIMDGRTYAATPECLSA
jgi:hypothetical protein